MDNYKAGIHSDLPVRSIDRVAARPIQTTEQQGLARGKEANRGLVPGYTIKLPGRLIGGPLRAFSAIVDEVPMECIKHANAIPDYRNSYDQSYPVAIQQEDQYEVYIIDGWNLIEEARDRGFRTVQCKVYIVEYADDITHTLLKFSIRLKSEAGTTRFPEILRNVRLLETMLGPGTDLRPYSRGGDRRSAQFRDAHDDFRTTLCEWSEKSPKSVSKYILFSQALSLDTLNKLADEAGCTKAFFEKIQARKQEIIRGLRGENAVEREITNRVSATVLEWWQSYKTSGQLPETENRKRTVPFDNNSGSSSPEGSSLEVEDETTIARFGSPVASKVVGSENVNHEKISEYGPKAAVELHDNLKRIIGRFLDNLNPISPLEETTERLSALIVELTSISESMERF